VVVEVLEVEVEVVEAEVVEVEVVEVEVEVTGGSVVGGVVVDGIARVVGSSPPESIPPASTTVVRWAMARVRLTPDVTTTSAATTAQRIRRIDRCFMPGQTTTLARSLRCSSVTTGNGRAGRAGQR
jgi:hypothetical protein